MLLTDTDSLTYKIETENVYENFYKNRGLFDFSNYSKDSNSYGDSNNFVIGKMKDETCDLPVNFFVVLKVKIYTFITEDNHECKKAKGINKYVVDDKLKYEDFENILFNRSIMRHERTE